jgi:hypothetical protein
MTEAVSMLAAIKLKFSAFPKSSGSETQSITRKIL